MADRLGNDGYIKPAQTFTDRLSKDEISKLLEDYTKKNIKDISKGSHVRYFTKDKDGVVKFRFGGVLINDAGLPDYIILSNGHKSWSVQTLNTIFYEKISNEEIKKEYKDLLFKKDSELDSYKIRNKELLIEKKQFEQLIIKKNEQIDALQKKNDSLKMEIQKIKKK